jgi:uncharacterized protein
LNSPQDRGPHVPRLKLVILQPTPFCNISCKYCYLPDRAATGKMSIETINRTFSAIRASGWTGEMLDVVWHAGEPLVMPVDYYAEAFRAVAALTPERTTIRHCFQTNGMLIDAGWCEFFAASRANVGVSVDGPAALNDLGRLTRSGKSTFSQTMAGIHLMQENDIPFYVISVLGDAALDRARELFEFYRDEGIRNICFNIEEIEGPNVASSLSRADRRQRFELFLREFWTLTQNSQERYSIREFREMLDRVLAPAEIAIPNDLVEPFAVLNVDWQGNFTTFSPELLGQKNAKYDDFIIGNVWRTTLEQARTSESFRRMERDILAGVELCRKSCEHFPICGGGEPSNKLYENGTFVSTETMFCQLRTKVVADLSVEIVERSAAAQAAGEALPVETADLYLMGAGIFFPDHLTAEETRILASCARICTILSEAHLALLPGELRAKCVSLWPLYQDKRRRSENYRDVTQAVIEAVERERPVAWFTPGHPMIFDSVSTALLRTGQKRGWRVRVVPAISCFDTLLAELGYDPAEGLLIHEATSVVVREIPLRRSIATLLLQPGVFNSALAHTATPFADLDLARLRDYLLRFFPPDHRCAFVRSAEKATERAQIVWLRLRNMASAPYETVVGSTLFLPATEDAAATVAS